MDIYFTEEYGKLCEVIEKGTSQVFRYKSEYGEIQHQFIKREIPQLVDGKQYFDITTPYGYGGPLILSVQNGKKEQLCEEFGKAFARYCEENRIVSEFVRFHPIKNNAVDFEKLYHPIYIRNTLGTNLSDFDDPVQSEFSKGCRKSIRQALHEGITYRVTENPDSLDTFIEIYYATMKRDHATDFYYFDRSYFEKALQFFKKQILLIEAFFEEKTIAAGLYFISDGVIHVHLSGTLSDYLYLSPAYILRYAATLWGKEHGYMLIHHGGGTSNARDNSLFLFKKQFAQNTEFEFYVGKKVWDQKIYKKLCITTGAPIEGEYFPVYRG